MMPPSVLNDAVRGSAAGAVGRGAFDVGCGSGSGLFEGLPGFDWWAAATGWETRWRLADGVR